MRKKMFKVFDMIEIVSFIGLFSFLFCAYCVWNCRNDMDE